MRQSRNKILDRYGLLALVAAGVILLDQVTKAVVRANIPFGSQWMPVDWIAPFFRFVHWENTGAAFGLFQQGGILFGVLAVLVAVFIVIYFPQIPREERLMRIALAMQLGGALGNLVDRIRLGAVTDFISVGTFPVFNIADSSITVGVGLLLLSLWLAEKKEKKRTLKEQTFSSSQSDSLDESV